VALVVLVLLAGSAWAAYYYYLLRPQTSFAAGKPVEITIPTGSTTEKIGERLAAAGVIPNALMFRVKVRLSPHDGNLKAGTYALRTGMEYDPVILKLAKGPDIVYYDVPIPEGFTAKQIAARFAKRAHLSEDELLALVTKGAPRYAPDHPYLKKAYRDSLEGYLFPATYRVKKGTSATQAVEMMLDKADSELAGVDLGYAKSKNLDVRDVITIASMIEHEAKLSKEYPLVSSVIYNRLRIPMRLQFCSTVLYGLPNAKQTVTNADLKVDHPYNTYLHDGLPPGPISNPGMKSIQAAAHPAKTRYIYYVLTGRDGSHTFTTNYADFLKAKAVYEKKFNP
jgi:UPF0755 protein